QAQAPSALAERGPADLLSACEPGRAQGVTVRDLAHGLPRFAARGADDGLRRRRARAQAPHPVPRRPDARASGSRRGPRRLPRARGGPGRGRKRRRGRQGGARPDVSTRPGRRPVGRGRLRRPALTRRRVFSAFLIASFILAVTPGPGVLYIVTRSLMQGRRSGLASVAGVALGNLGNALGAAIGLAALFGMSSLAFTLVKYVGAAYLVWLGVQTLQAKPAQPQAIARARERLGRFFRDGLLVALLNPKTALFFAAFLPQFMSPGGPLLVQSMLLGSIFVAIAAVTDTAYALAAGAVAPALKRARGVRA